MKFFLREPLISLTFCFIISTRLLFHLESILISVNVTTVVLPVEKKIVHSWLVKLDAYTDHSWLGYEYEMQLLQLKSNCKMLYMY